MGDKSSAKILFGTKKRMSSLKISMQSYSIEGAKADFISTACGAIKNHFAAEGSAQLFINKINGIEGEWGELQ